MGMIGSPFDNIHALRAEDLTFNGTDLQTFRAITAPGSGDIKSLHYYRDHGMKRDGNNYWWYKSTTANGCDSSPCLPVDGPQSTPIKTYGIGGAIEWFPSSATSTHNPAWASGKLNDQNALLIHDYQNATSGALNLKPADNWIIELGIISYYGDNTWMKENWLPQCSGGGWGCFADSGITGYGRSSGTGDGPNGQSWEAFKIKLYGSDVGGSNDYLSIDIDNAVSGIDKFRYRTKGSMEGQNTRIGNTNSQGGRDKSGSGGPYNGAVAVVFLGAEYKKTGCKDANANNDCSDCTENNASDCRYDNTTVTSFTTSASSGVAGDSVRLDWVIASPLLQTATITKTSGGGTNKTFPLNVKNQGNSGFVTVRLDEAGTYRFKLAVTGVGNKSGNKYTSNISIVEPSPDEILGCTDSSAPNYNAAATTDNGSCIKPGCIDSNATNYDATATEDDGTCVMPEDDECTTSTDCPECEKCEADSDDVLRCVTDPDCTPEVVDVNGCLPLFKTIGSDGTCGDCKTGYEENADGDCVAVSSEDEEEEAISPLMIGGAVAGVALLVILMLKK
jgi:hypothetical protein